MTADAKASAADVVLALDVEASGRILAAGVERSTLDHPRFGACLETSLRRVQFDPPPTGARISMPLPLRLQDDGVVGYQMPDGTKVAPEPAPPPRSLFVLAFRAGSAGEAASAQLATDLLVTELTERGLEVRTMADVDALLRLERERDLLGCSDVSCAADIAGAFGYDLIGYGTVTAPGGERSLAVSIIGRDAVVVARSVVVSDTSDPIEPAVATLGRELLLQLRR